MQEPFTIKNPSGQKIRAFLHKPDDFDKEKQYPLIIYVHGFKGFMDQEHIRWYADFFTKHNFCYVRFDFTHGTGKSDGDIRNLTVSHYIEDLRCMIDYVSSIPYAEGITLLCASLGGFVSILSDLSKVKNLITLGALSDFSVTLYMKCDLGDWKENGFAMFYSNTEKKTYRVDYAFYDDGMKHDILGAASRIRIPWLIIHGSADRSVPVDQAFALHEACPGSKLQIFPNAPHTFKDPVLLERAANFMLDWISAYK
ncbi:hypothetical protein JW968_05060 [Candidatus Woesearchaeota archaeon]|nr:hypothetical protein [Candidatus Woesearchaeota archaeon]